MTMNMAFALADDVLRAGIQGISDTITVPGLINLDFADVKSVMSDAGSALMAIGRASGDNRAVEAARAAVASPLLDVSIEGAKGVLFNITGSDYTLFEVNEAAQIIQEAADPDANIIFGAVVDETLQGALQITVIATGFDVRARGGPPARGPHQVRASAPGRDDRAGSVPPPEPPAAPRPERPVERYDVPAFLRRRR
jgi:cell division protein FtsZ